MNEIIITSPSLYQQIIGSLTCTIPANAVVDITGTIFFTLALLFTDVMLRITIECNNYLKTTGKSYTLCNIITTFLWYGWGSVTLPNGSKCRFLISKGMRTALVLKMAVQYPVLFAFSVLSFLLPDVEIIGWRFDYVVSFAFLIIPVLCEITSIIEKLNMLDAEIIKIGHAFIRFIKSVRG